ncbi:MAG: M28 family metallopeptidase [Parvularculaceae bacterium]
MNSLRWTTALSAVFLLFGCGGEESVPPPEETTAVEAEAETESEMVSTPEITGADLARHIEILASDEFEGRAPATPGGEKARNYIAEEYKKLGLEPIGDSYFQSVPLVETTLDPDTSYFRVEGGGDTRDLEYKKDIVYWTKRVEEEVSFDASDMVFVGYGVVAPEYDWNDYESVDVKGKTVVMLVNDPGFATQNPELFNGNAMTYYGRWTYKYEEAARQGAAAALIIHDTAPAAYGWGVVEGSWSGPQIDLDRADGGAGRVKAEGWLSNDAAHALFDAAGLDLDALQDAAKAPGFEAVAMDGLTASAKLSNGVRRSEDANVVGVLRGSEAPDEYVLYMGHWDHLGLNPDQEGDDKIFNGAVDNATGVAAILEIAERFATNAERPRRSILLLAVTAEESGLLGSAYFGEEPLVPLKNIVGGVNIDAVLPSPPAKDLIVIGYGASELEDLLNEAAMRHGRYLRPDAEPEKGYFYRSDHISLAKKGVPMLYADSGIDLRNGGEEAGRAFSEDYVANRYHSPADEYDESWDLTGMTETTRILYEVGESMAYSDAWPNWREGNEFRALRDAQRLEE